MKRFALGVLVALVLVTSARPARAQEPTFPGCPQCGISGYVDIPAKGATVSRADLVNRNAAFAGWGLERVSGKPIDRVTFSYEGDNTDVWYPLKQKDDALWASYVYRPDVVLAYGPWFPAVYIYGSMSGWVLWMDNPPPVGARRVMVQLWRGPYHADVLLTLNIVE